MMHLITTACEASISRMGPSRNKPTMGWWTTEIANLQKEYHCPRCFVQYLHAREAAYAIKAVYRSGKGDSAAHLIKTKLEAGRT